MMGMERKRNGNGTETKINGNGTEMERQMEQVGDVART